MRIRLLGTKPTGGLTRENGDAYRRNILAIGGSKPIPEGFKELTGREADIQPLLKRRGLL